MKPTDFFEAVDRFFLDLIGWLIPGILLILGCSIILDKPLLLGSISLFPPVDTFSWVFLAIIGYVTGHAVMSIGQNIVLPVIEFIANLLRKTRVTAVLAPNVVVSELQLMERIANSANFRAMVEHAGKEYPWLKSETNTIANVHSWRNIALTIAQEQSHTVYRFMFISLLNLGIATVFLFLTVMWLSLFGLNYLHIVSIGIPINLAILIILILIALLFLERRYRFYDIAMRVPFSMAVIKLQQTKAEIAPAKSELSEDLKEGLPLTLKKYHRPPRVYLAGGFKSGWQDRVIYAVPWFTFFDPRDHSLKDVAHYVFWDLEAIRQCDWLFAYLETTNPGGYALTFELGYAKALGKRIILVDEKSSSNEQSRGYLAMVHTCADVTFDSFEDSLKFMKTLEKAW